ncbi:MAG: hypothetical protein RL299_930 [Pseudomonadota bacterium]|jgi:hypothetical protein
MLKVLLAAAALVAVFFAGLFVAIPPPFSWVRDAAIAVLALLAGVQWAIYTAASDPEKLARFVAKYLPRESVEALISQGSDSFSRLVAKAKGVMLRE